MAIKCLIITDPMGQETSDEIIERISSGTDTPIENFVVLAHHQGVIQKTKELAERADVLIIDYGGMSWGATDMVVSQIRFVCEWAKEHPSKLAIIFTSFTAEIYAQALYDDFKECENIPYLYADAYSADREKVSAWLKTF
jgi:hypothetical protein